MKSSRARALVQSHGYVVPEDLFALAQDVLLHRIRLSYEALAEGKTAAGVLNEVRGNVNALQGQLAQQKSARKAEDLQADVLAGYALNRSLLKDKFEPALA